MDGRQISTRSAAIALAFWLLLVVAALAWWRPRFWDEPHQRFERAQGLVQQGRKTEALAAAGDAVASSPTNTGYLIFKAYRELDLNKVADAEQTFRQALAQEPSNIDASLGFATALARRGARTTALRVLQSLSPAALSEAQVRQRSQVYAELRAHVLALDDLSQLLHRDPSNPELLQEATLHARAINDWQRTGTLALRVTAASSDPKVREWANQTRAEALDASGAPQEPRAAVDHFRELVRLRPGEPHLRRSLARALQADGRRAEAEAVFRALLDESAADRDTRIAFAWMLNTERRHAEAWNVIEPLPRPDSEPDVLELQARTALWAGRPQEALHLVSALVAARPHHAELWKRLAEIWQALGDHGAALEALTRYMRLNAQDADARRQLADMLSATGSLGAAIEHYKALAAADPDNPALLRRLGLLQETSGDLAAAKVSYLSALRVSAAGEIGDLYLRIARLHRWTAQPAEAVGWYEKHIERERDPILQAQVESELAIALLDSGNAERSLVQLSAAASRRQLDAGDLLVAARAAHATGRSAAAARFLEHLGQRRPLTVEEERWLAGLYRASGRPADALATYVQLAERARPSPDVLEAIGDLRFDAGDFAGALAAFDKIADPPSAVWVKRARAAGRLGRAADARAAYERYLREHPDDTAVRLEAARQEAASGRAAAAIEHYKAVIASRGPADLRLELAQLHLAVDRYGDAEQWARQALAAGEAPDHSRLALAQSLHLQGRIRQAEAVLAEQPRGSPLAAETLVWRSRMAMALNRPLDAYQAAQRALSAGAQPRDQLLLWMASAARRRGDYARAHAALAGVTATDARNEELTTARAQLNADTAATIGLPAWLHSDTNDVRLRSSGVRVMLFLPARLASVMVGVSAGSVSQRSFSSQRTSAAVTLGHLYPVPEVELTLGAGFDHYDRAPDLFNWRAQATYFRAGGSMAGLSAAREPLLPVSSDTWRQYNRALDIGALGPGFHLHAMRAFIDRVTGSARRLRVEAGVDAFADGNRRASSYLHYQIPVPTDAQTFVAIRPNLYFETFRDARPEYFSPGRHLTTGVMVHGIRRFPRWHVELELNPQWLRTSGTNGFGAHGLIGGGATFGRVSLSAGAFLFYDGLEDYLQRRVTGRVTVAVGPR